MKKRLFLNTAYFFALPFISCSSDKEEPINLLPTPETNAIINIVSEGENTWLFDERVVGRETVRTIAIENTGNTSLEITDLKLPEGLIKLNSAGGFISIAANDVLQNIDGLSNLISAKDLTIFENPLITNLNGLENLELVQEDVTIVRNKSLYNFCGIKMLLETGGLGEEFSFTWDNRYNPSVTDIVNAECSREIPLDTYHGEKRFLSQVALDEFLEAGYTKLKERQL